jgi:hypothetical protein
MEREVMTATQRARLRQAEAALQVPPDAGEPLPRMFTVRVRPKRSGRN